MMLAYLEAQVPEQGVPLICGINNPCACKMERQYRTRKGFDFEWKDYICDDVINEQRKHDGVIPSAFTCVQLKSEKKLCEDDCGETVGTPEVFHSKYGCEMRTVTPPSAVKVSSVEEKNRKKHHHHHHRHHHHHHHHHRRHHHHNFQ